METIDLVAEMNKMFGAIASLPTKPEKPKEENLIKAPGLDPDKPYNLGLKDYYYKRECNSGHTDLSDEEIGFSGGVYDGLTWTVPVCKRCISQQKDKRLDMYSHYTPFHLKEA
jgi:hypothetical protein